MSFNLDSLFVEWRSKVSTGVPNPKNAYHLVLLKEICLNRGIDVKIVDNVILALEQDDKKIDPETIVKYKGEILCLSECSDGIPSHGKFYSLLSEFSKPEQVEGMLSDPNFHCQDQWQVQILSQIAKKSKINLYTEGLSNDEIKNAFMFNVSNPQNFVDSIVKENNDIRGCVLPEGPITIPVLKNN